jgi:glycosyltransferase involved in cell wall biosynthesis
MPSASSPPAPPCPALPFPWEVVCVNDGSRDRTPQLVRELQQHQDTVKEGSRRLLLA